MINENGQRTINKDKWQGEVDMKKQMTVILAFLGLMLASGMAMAAAPVGDITYDSIMQAATTEIPGDWSRKLWRYAFGDFAENPLTTLGGPSTLLGAIFLVFNSCVFVVGGMWATYGIVSSITTTAHDGEALGQRMSTVWYPIRITTGVAGMLPVLGGFSVQQGIMMFLMIIGIGIGNTTMLAAINNADAGKALIADDDFSPSVRDTMRGMTKSMFLSNICATAQSADDQNMAGARSINEILNVKFEEERPGVHILRYGSQSNPTSCGFVRMDMNEMNRSDSSTFGYRVQSVDYAAIATATQRAYVQAMDKANQDAGRLAADWMQQRDTAIANGQGTPAYPEEQLNQIYIAIAKNVRQALLQAREENSDGAFREQAKANMKALGWMGLGAWYQTFAEHNAALADAAQGPSISFNDPTMAGNGMSTLSAAAADAVNIAVAKENQSRSEAKAEGADKEVLNNAIQDFCVKSGLMGSVDSTATGNCSLGQAIVSGVIKTAAVGSGGGDLINPVIAMKNIGDAVMNFSSGIIGTVAIAKMIMKTPLAKGFDGMTGMVSKVMSMMPSGASQSSGGGFSFTTLAWMLLLCGAFLSLYLPLIPFITWMGAIIAYVASMFEGLVGAQLHSLSHLDTQGDGMGQRTSHGYIFMINALFRPALMVIAFFLASFCLIAIGTLQFQLFMPAIANVQGNSLTGLVSILGFLVIFSIMNVTLVHGAFNLIYVITDQVIGFIGGSINTQMGRDTEQSVNRTFMLAAGAGPRMVQQSMMRQPGGLGSRPGSQGDTPMPNGSPGASSK